VIPREKLLLLLEGVFAFQLYDQLGEGGGRAFEGDILIKQNNSMGVRGGGQEKCLL